MNQAVTEFASAEEEARALSLLTLEERIAYRKRQYGSRINAQREAQQAEWRLAQERAAANRAEAKRLQQQRQAANHARRAAENQRIRSDRNSNRK